LFLFLAIFLVVTGAIRHSEVARQALAKAQSNPSVIEKLGTPIEEGWLASGSISTSGASGDADLVLPIHGPKGNAKLYVVAKKSAGEWTYKRMEVCD